MEDRFGRCTYFHVDINGTKLPVYQPGSVMFDSAVKDGPMAVHHGGSQQNGPILGKGCAMFLAKFMATLAKSFGEEPLTSVGLKEKLDGMANLFIEDVNEHGRLLTMKEIFVTYLDASEVTINLLSWL